MEPCDGGDIAPDGLTVFIDRYKVVVVKSVWVSMKGELGRANVEVLRLEAHVALMTICNDLLEHQFNDLKATKTTLRMKHRQQKSDNW